MARFGACLLATLTVLFYGCAAAPPPVPRYPAFPENEYARLAAGGTVVISGQAFLKTRGGEVRRGAGSEVTLDLETSYSRPWWNSYAKLWAFRRNLPPDPRFLAYRRTTTADADGHFKFTGLPSGTYLIRSAVVWEVPGLLGATPSGGLVFDTVEARDGEQKEIILTWR
jgi:hypothetical protein